jgi:molybdenum cofactor cytidylyltransferase
MAEIPLLLLAAGASSRMGQPKPLLPWGELNLIEHQVRILLKTNQPVAVVLGSGAAQVIPVIEKYPLQILINKHWKRGIGSSIASGVEQLLRKLPDAAGVVITLVDQPLISYHHYNKMIRLFQPGSEQILVSRTDSGWQGVPVLFDQFYFQNLQTLTGDEGAKTILKRYPDAVQSIRCNEILDDMDTPQDYQRLLSFFHNPNE